MKLNTNLNKLSKSNDENARKVQGFRRLHYPVNASNKIDAIDEQLVHDIMESCAKKIHEC
jgi:hypothetical protein